MKILSFLLIIFLSNLSIAQSIQWQKSLGGTNNERANRVKQTTDGGYIIAGESYSNDGDVSGNHGVQDAWIVKLTNIGGISWQKSLGGTGDERITSIQQTMDGGYIVAGETNSNDGDISGNNGLRDYWIVKLTSLGIITWQKSLGGSSFDHGYNIQQTTDGGYIVTGNSSSNDGDVTGNHGSVDGWIVKLTSTGNITWEKSFGGSSADYLTRIQQTSDGGYVALGSSFSNNGDVTVNNGSIDYWVIKLTSNGNITWEKSLGGTNSDLGSSIKQTTDGGYIVTGSSDSNDGDITGNKGGFDVWAVKLTSTGIISWQKSLGGTGDDYGVSIQQTIDGKYIIAAYSNSLDGDVTGNHGLNDYWLVKLTTTGVIDWQKSLGGGAEEWANHIQQTTDGGYIVVGFSDSNDGDVSGNHAGTEDFWVVKLFATVGLKEYNLSNISLYPNPTTENITIDLGEIKQNVKATLTNSLGQVILSKNYTSTNIINLDIDAPSGIYFLHLEIDGEVITKKIIKE
ncbi:MAG: secretion protein [Flavobacteriales bacterium]|nr:MAG: secretion protein [Flavobacteriales bacterium]